MSAQKSGRRRGCVLSVQGQHKLNAARAQAEQQQNFGDRFTHEQLCDRTGLSLNTIVKILKAEIPVDRQSIDKLFHSFGLILEVQDYIQPDSAPVTTQTAAVAQIDWGEAPDVALFYGRNWELAKLNQWISIDRAKLVALLGLGGIGKTLLATQLAQQLASEFEFVIWRSLRNAPPLFDVLADVIDVLSERQETAGQLPKNVAGLLSRLLHYMRNQRCLLIFDNAETILQSGGRAGDYRAGYEDYGDLLQQIGTIAHQSCLILTSREKPDNVAVLEGELLPVRSLQLTGLSVSEVQTILTMKGLHGTESEIEQLANCYSGNPLALKIVATSINDLFDGKITSFLNHGITIFNGIRLLLDHQFARLSHLEHQIMYWLAINREPVSLWELQTDLVPTVSNAILLESLESLDRRCLIETVALSGTSNLMGFTQQPVVMEYISDRLIEQVCQELDTSSLALFHTHALIKATAKDYIRTSQIRVILAEVANRLQRMLGSRSAIVDHLQQVLATLRQNYLNSPGYSGGNWINLCTHFKIDLAHANLSQLTIWQADLRQVPLQYTNFANADLTRSVFAEGLSNTLSVTFSPNGRYLASGDGDGGIRLWQVSGGDRGAPSRIGKLLRTLRGHQGWVHSVCFSPGSNTRSNQPIIASGSADRTIRLWDLDTGRCLQILRGHTSAVWCVSFSPDGRWLASGSDDHTLRLWNPINGQCLHVLQGHTNQVYALSFSPNGQWLISGSSDQTLRFWPMPSQDTPPPTVAQPPVTEEPIQCLKVLQTEGTVSSVHVSPNGERIATGSLDHIVQIWDWQSEECLTCLRGHTDQVWCTRFSPDGERIASGSHDQTVRLWDLSSGRCLKVLHGHTDRIWSIDFTSDHPISDHPILVSGSMDQTMRLWDVATGQCLQLLRGHTNPIYAVHFSPDGVLASGSEDGIVRLWDWATETCCHKLTGHTAGIWALQSSADGRWLASGANDHTIRLWNLQEAQSLRILRGHDGWVLAVQWSPEGQGLATGSADNTAKLWNLQTGECENTLFGHTSWVFAVDISPDGQRLATGSADQTVRLWDRQTGECLTTLTGHQGWIRSVDFSPDGRFLASGGTDHTLRLWDVTTGQCVRVMEGHTNWIWSVCFSPTNIQQTQETENHPLLLASSGDDSTIRLWDGLTGDCLRILQGQTQRIWSLAFSSDGRSLASSSSDETIALWDVETGDRRRTLKAENLYQGLNIQGVLGLSEGQMMGLKQLGAIDE